MLHLNKFNPTHDKLARNLRGAAGRTKIGLCLFCMAGWVNGAAGTISAPPETRTKPTPYTTAQNAIQARESAATARGEANHTAENLPRLELTRDLFGRILAAEIVSQRGYVAAASQGMLTLAQDTRDPRLARRSMEMAIRARNGEQALQAARLWQELAPNDSKALQALAFWQVITGRLADAENALRKRLYEAKPNDRPEVLSDIQQTITNAPDRVAAHQLLVKLINANPELNRSALAQLTLARTAFAAGDLIAAQLYSRAALRLQPDFSEAVLALAQLIGQESTDKEEVSTLLRQFLQRNPQARDVRLTLAQHYQRNGQIPDAVRELETLLEQTPQETGLLLNLARLHLQLNQSIQAAHYLERYATLLPKLADTDNLPAENEQASVYLTLGQLAEERQNWAEALTWYEKIQAGDPYIMALGRRAHVLAKTGKLMQARALLQNAEVVGDKDRGRLLLAEAALLREARQEKVAQQVLQKAVDQYPDNPDVLYDYALGAERQRDFGAMEKSLRKVIALRPQDAHAYNALGYSFADRNIRLPEALELIEQALRLMPDDAMITDSLGWVHYRLGNLDLALDALQRAYRARPDAEIGAHLGEVMWVKGLNAEARKIWRAALQREPENEVVQATLQRFLGQSKP